MTAKIKKEKKSILLENTFLPFGVEMLFSWFIIVLFTMYLHLQTGNLGVTKILSYMPLSSSIISNYKSNCNNQQNKYR